MSYKKPICDCGAELKLWREDIYDIETPITKDGFPSKKGIVKTAGLTPYFTRLVCPDCSNEYEENLDKKERIIRGEKH